LRAARPTPIAHERKALRHRSQAQAQLEAARALEEERPRSLRSRESGADESLSSIRSSSYGTTEESDLERRRRRRLRRLREAEEEAAGGTLDKPGDEEGLSPMERLRRRRLRRGPAAG
jgi:hypothetical protein